MDNIKITITDIGKKPFTIYSISIVDGKSDFNYNLLYDIVIDFDNRLIDLQNDEMADTFCFIVQDDCMWLGTTDTRVSNLWSIPLKKKGSLYDIHHVAIAAAYNRYINDNFNSILEEVLN